LKLALLPACLVVLSACGGGGGGGAVNGLRPNGPSPDTPVITSSTSMARTGQSINFVGSSAAVNNLPLVYSWDFGDGAKDTGTTTSHAYMTIGTFTVTLTVTDTARITASTKFFQNVGSPNDNSFIPDCSGTNCSASSPTAYTGSGPGVWRYNNTTDSNATIDINIGGVSPGNTVTLLFSNGGTAVASSPVSGVLATPVASSPLTVSLSAPVDDADSQHQHDSNHLKMLVENLKLASELSASTSSSNSIAANSNIAPPPPPMPTPAVGDTRSWKEFAFDMKNYSATVHAICSVPNGRNVVIWVDSSYGNTVFDTDITAFSSAYCGNTGGYARLATLLGDAWGTVPASQSPYLISDLPTKQDINIVIVAATTNYGGYFWGENNFVSTSYPNSNEALVFFINGNGMRSGVNYYVSALLHESTHMINFYQRAVMRSAYHDTWLEETSAMMSEDIVTPAVLGGYNTVATTRVPNYVSTGGAVSYINWSQLSNNDYALGGAFGGYLNRRYGISIFEQLITDCNTGTSYACLDNLIKNNGGPGFAIDFARFGASIFAGLPATGMPAAYAYPATVSGAYSFAAIDVPTNAPATATALSSFTATTHTYNQDVVASGYTSYVRTGVVVPANTTLIVVVK
jgi:Peptidase M30/PKD domain